MIDTLYVLCGLAFWFACFRVGGLCNELYTAGRRLLPLTAACVMVFLATHLP